MAAPSTWVALEAFETCLQTISVANGYHTDAGATVTREPHQIPATAGVAVAVVLEGKGPATDPAMRRTHRLATVIIAAKVDSDDNNDAQERLHELMDDIEQAFECKQTQFPSSYQYPAFVDAKPIPPAEGMTWIGAQVRYSLHIPKR